MTKIHQPYTEHFSITEELTSSLREKSLFDSRCIFMSEGVTSNTAKRIISDLILLDKANSSDPIILYINSPGGEVNSGFAIYDVIRYIEAPVTMVTAGLCASIATIINVAVPRERRLGLPNSKYLIHQPLIAGQVYGQASDIEITATQIVKTRAKINQVLAEACNQSIDRLTEDTTRDYWMGAEEALEYGLIGKIITRQSEI
ncbi:MAG: ATP-dependent Clp protease proteolytic subunit [Zetaproteobacteria bacterium]|nr:ATP-dependent Clp protease proteolytic subunit [Zetaproteobacteria bacterium]